MKLAAIISILAIVQARSVDNNIDNEDETTTCEGIMVNGVYHEKEVLKTDVDRPYLLAMDHAHDILYFSYSINDEEDVQSAYIDINTKYFKNITNIPNGFTQSVDPITHEVYIGGNDGIYKYDRNNDQSVIIAGKDKNIFTLFAKGDLYYTEFPSQFLYKVSNGETERFKDLEDTKVDHFLIDKDDNMFYTNSTGLYKQKKGTKNSVLIKGSEILGIRGVNTDVLDNVYVCNINGIYKVKKAEAELEKLLDIDDGFGFAFDKHNNVIYADATQVVLLRPNSFKTC